jgi:hypothetical protein
MVILAINISNNCHGIENERNQYHAFRKEKWNDKRVMVRGKQPLAINKLHILIATVRINIKTIDMT